MKIHPKKPVGGTQFGTTITDSDPAKFKGAGKSSGKTKSNGVVVEAKGAVFTENSTHIPAMNADKAPMDRKDTKVTTGRVKISEHDTACDATASQSGSGSPTTRPYPLKTSYGK